MFSSLREEAAILFRLEHALDADGHGRGPVRNLVFLGPPDDLRERMFQDTLFDAATRSLQNERHEGLDGDCSRIEIRDREQSWNRLDA